MMRETAVPVMEQTAEDRSMRVVEYAMAIVAAVVAGVLAFIR